MLPLPSAVAEIKGQLRSLDLVFALPMGSGLRRSVHLARRVEPHLPAIKTGVDRITHSLTSSKPLPLTRDLVRQIGPLRVAYRDLSAETVRFFDLVEAESSEVDIEAARREARTGLSTMGRALIRFETDVTATLDRAVIGFSDEEQRAVWGTIILATVAMIIGIIITWTSSRLLRPLRDLRAGVGRIAEGRYDEPVHVDTHGELGELAAEFNRMADAIQKRDAQLAEQQKALVHRERLATVGRMSAQITHELRNPLSSIGLNSELLLEELEDDQAGRPLLQSIIREVERLREITEEYLRFSRLPRPERYMVDLNHAVAELLDFVRGEMNRAHVKTRLDAGRAAKPAWVDPNQLRAALLNLLRNAREAITDAAGGGHIVVRVRTLGEYATIEVIDDGPGMSESATEHLFEPFFSTKPQGTGLGLSLVREIVRAQSGEITVVSVPGKGTTIRMTLPLTRPDHEEELG